MSTPDQTQQIADAVTQSISGFKSIASDEGSVSKFGAQETVALLEYQRRDCARTGLINAYAKGHRAKIVPPNALGQ